MNLLRIANRARVRERTLVYREWLGLELEGSIRFWLDISDECVSRECRERFDIYITNLSQQLIDSARVGDA